MQFYKKSGFIVTHQGGAGAVKVDDPSNKETNSNVFLGQGMVGMDELEN
jgi:hypothetical protein